MGDDLVVYIQIARNDMSRCVIAERRMVKAHFIFLVSQMLIFLRRIRFTNWNFVRMLYTNQYLRIKRQISVCQYVVVPADKLLLTLFLFVENYYYAKFQFVNRIRRGFNQDLIDLTHSDNVSSFTSSLVTHILAYSSTESIAPMQLHI
jgi:hypothetical protein